MRRCPARLYNKKVLFFDGVDDYVETGFSGKLSTLSVEALVKTNFDFDFTDSLIVANRNLAVGRYGWNLYALQTKEIGFQTGDGELWYNAEASFADKVDMWVHVIGVHDGSKNYLYVNGELTTSVDAKPVVYTDQHLVTVSREPTDEDRFFHGIIALIRIYNRVLEEEEIRRLKNDAFNLRPASIRDGLVLEFIPDSLDCENGVWRDNSGYGNHGTIYGARCISI